MELALGPRQRVLKRAMDIIGAVVGLIICSPVLIVVALLVWLHLGRPVFYCQFRPGLYGKLFPLCKFRTMTDARDAEGTLLPDGERLTRLGGFLRKTSLDELPELWSVLRGEMSLVGPRPLLREYLPYYTEREARRHTVRPGITGLAQVSGRNLLGWDERLELDIQYIERWSACLDLWILGKTLLQAAARKGVVAIPGSLQGPLHHVRSR
jgi:lipopolysaccharide/colanic/teichoic acid biosynthesis glycosyltransferase